MIIAGNFKTNHTRKSTQKYIKELSKFVDLNSIKDEIIIFPTATSVDNFSCENIKIGIQNAYHTQKGSFTGEIGISQLEEFDIKTILIGHSERREILKEPQSMIKEKYDFFKSHGYQIIYCIGEPLKIREEVSGAIFSYLQQQLDGIDLEYSNLIIAYEPIWAIGTGLVAKVEDIKNVHDMLKTKTKTEIIYGGSVKPDNVKNILSIDSVDGVLVGTASLDIDSFCKIIK
jgi:triosephosphate isomerase